MRRLNWTFGWRHCSLSGRLKNQINWKIREHWTFCLLNCWSKPPEVTYKDTPTLHGNEITYNLCAHTHTRSRTHTHTYMAHVPLLHMHTATHGPSSGCTTHLPAAASHFALRQHSHISTPGRGRRGRQVWEREDSCAGKCGRTEIRSLCKSARDGELNLIWVFEICRHQRGGFDSEKHRWHESIKGLKWAFSFCC